jgi:hypothetical protein
MGVLASRPIGGCPVWRDEAMRKVLAFALTGVILGSVQSVALAGGGCVSRPEYRDVEIGMRQSEVRNIFGTAGERISHHGAREEYAYDFCAGGVVFVDYRSNVVTAKQLVLGE